MNTIILILLIMYLLEKEDDKPWESSICVYSSSSNRRFAFSKSRYKYVKIMKGG